jgi:sulfide dehydrogenase cytochrome subunit
MKPNSSSLLAVLLVFAAATAVAEDIGSIVDTCNDCHGGDGVSQWTDVPTIAGISAVVQEDALFIYRDKERPCAESKFRQGDTSRAATTMCDISADLSDEAIEEIAAHYADLPFVPAKQEFDAALAASGAEIHKNQCDKCHTGGGANAEDDASILAGQQMGYLEASMAQYASDEREQPPKMKEKVDLLSADDVKALLHYYASQQ